MKREIYRFQKATLKQGEAKTFIPIRMKYIYVNGRRSFIPPEIFFEALKEAGYNLEPSPQKRINTRKYVIKIDEYCPTDCVKDIIKKYKKKYEEALK